MTVRFGRYQLVERVASGGMSEIWRATVRGPRGAVHSVIVKRLRPELARTPAYVAMLAAEARLCARLDHPAIGKVFESGETGGEYYLAMELLDGWTLGDVLRRIRHRGAPLDAALVCHVIAEVADALDHAYGAPGDDGRPLELVHRDVTPHNIMVTRHGAVKLIDFGTARSRDRQPDERTGLGAVKGTPAYMSPEQADGLDIDRRSDVFSLGVVLHESLTGARLFRGATPLDTLRRVREAKVALPSSIAAGIAPELDRIALRMLAADPEDRYPDTAEVARALRTIARHGGADAIALRDALRDLERDPGPMAPAVERPRVRRRVTAPLSPDRRRWSPWAVAAALTALAAAPYAIPRSVSAPPPTPAADHGASFIAVPAAAPVPPSLPRYTQTPGTSRR